MIPSSADEPAPTNCRAFDIEPAAGPTKAMMPNSSRHYAVQTGRDAASSSCAMTHVVARLPQATEDSMEPAPKRSPAQMDGCLARERVE
jgi:hypothetical protein